ncbi:hypothetical protein NDU88_004600 [Pleurodeles waltl]|uniref:Uncharacterized protein n=1 Tax=Pleurodeles waltl TaxID=8319 RepID=A0AAV7V1J2_PLEWA|nr:hypothetical protein NDU88_004600 [Pleurodeles waltl]
MFPVKLRIIQDGTTHFCASPAEAWTWFDARKKPKGRRRGSFRARPSSSQAEWERLVALQAVAELATMLGADGKSDYVLDLGVSVSGSGSSGLLEERLPVVTPQTAEDFI